MKFIALLLIGTLPYLLSAQEVDGPAEIINIMEQSKLLYEINLLEKPISSPDYSLNLNTVNFYRKKTEDGFATMAIELPEEANAIKVEAEKAFREKKYSAAREGYQKILDLVPEYSKMLTYIGQTHMLEGNGTKAIECYQQAIDNNPIDYMAHWFLARCYVLKGEEEKALTHYLNAHILNRNHSLIHTEINELLAEKNLKLENWLFNPQVKLSNPEEGKVVLAYQQEWLGYAITKAVWEYEPNYRSDKGEPEKFSMEEEKIALLSLYLGNAEKKTYEKLPYLLALHNTIKKGTVDPYIIYEVFLPKEPFIAYQLPDSTLELIRNYILDSRCVKLGKKKKKKGKKRKK